MLELGEVSLGTYPLSSALALTGAAINITNAIISIAGTISRVFFLAIKYLPFSLGGTIPLCTTFG